MDIASSIRHAANAIAQAAQHRAIELKREIVGLEEQLAEKNAALESSHRAHDRLLNFHQLVGSDYQCPRCWIEDEMRVPLHPVPADADNRDQLACERCGDHLAL
jgi:hypothetical protein